MMKKKSQAFAQGFIAFIVVAGCDRLFEQQLLDVLGKATPHRDYSRAQCQGKWSIAIRGHEPSSSR